MDKQGVIVSKEQVIEELAKMGIDDLDVNEGEKKKISPDEFMATAGFQQRIAEAQQRVTKRILEERATFKQAQSDNPITPKPRKKRRRKRR